MSRYEILSRASAFLHEPDRHSSNLALFTSGHVSHPHRFTRYYPTQDYLKALDDTHLRYSLELCEPGTGQVKVRQRLPLLPIVRHSSLDLSLMWLSKKESDALRVTLAACSAGVVPLLLERRPVENGVRVRVDGHFLQGTGETGFMLPRAIPGKVSFRSPAQVFLDTREVLEMGSCGGPVIGSEGTCVGMVEGIVPQHSESESAQGGEGLQAKAERLLGGCAVMIDAQHLSSLLQESLENGTLLQ